MAQENRFSVYILASHTRTCCRGVTNNLLLGVPQHEQKRVPGFTVRYNVTRLVYFEQNSGIGQAIAREKQNRGLLRKKKMALIESRNPEWNVRTDGYLPERLRKPEN